MVFIPTTTEKEIVKKVQTTKNEAKEEMQTKFHLKSKKIYIMVPEFQMLYSLRSAGRDFLTNCISLVLLYMA